MLRGMAQELTEKQIIAKITDLLLSKGMIDDKEAFLQTLQLDTSNGQRNGGSAATQPQPPICY